MTDPNVYPPGLDAERVKSIIEYYESQTADEAIAEMEAAWAEEDATTELLRVHNDLVPAVRALLKAYERARRTAECGGQPEPASAPAVEASPDPVAPAARRATRRTKVQQAGTR